MIGTYYSVKPHPGPLRVGCRMLQNNWETGSNNPPACFSCSHNSYDFYLGKCHWIVGRFVFVLSWKKTFPMQLIGVSCRLEENGILPLVQSIPSGNQTWFGKSAYLQMIFSYFSNNKSIYQGYFNCDVLLREGKGHRISKHEDFTKIPSFAQG